MDNEKSNTTAYRTPPGNGKADPTGNVLQLVDAAVQRLDDLREAETRRIDEKMVAQAESDGKLREAEAKRIDAIRAVDVNAVAVAAERSTQQATVLANQVAASAETLRGLVATTAAATATQLQQIVSPLTDRVALLEKGMYEGTGKAAVTDPQITALLNEMRAVRENNTLQKGTGAGMEKMGGWIVAAVLAIVTVFGGVIATVSVGIALYVALKR